MSAQPTIGFLVTCLVDAVRPNIGFAAMHLLEQTGCRVVVPELQTCCGQPAFNNGDVPTSQALALQMAEAFADCDYVVTPSGSCAGMVRCHYPELFEPHTRDHAQVQALADKCHELLSFLNDVIEIDINARFDGTVTYHDSCSGLRELGIRPQPRALLSRVDGLHLTEMEDTDVCCGFGGSFCVKFPDISARMVSDKVENIRASGADVVLSGDLGCLMNIAGRCQRLGLPVRCYHTAEVLAGMTGQAAPVCGPDKDSGV